MCMVRGCLNLQTVHLCIPFSNWLPRQLRNEQRESWREINDTICRVDLPFVKGMMVVEIFGDLDVE